MRTAFKTRRATLSGSPYDLKPLLVTIVDPRSRLRHRDHPGRGACHLAIDDGAVAFEQLQTNDAGHALLDCVDVGSQRRAPRREPRAVAADVEDQLGTG